MECSLSYFFASGCISWSTEEAKLWQNGFPNTKHRGGEGVTVRIILQPEAHGCLSWKRDLCSTEHTKLENLGSYT